jgi:archaellum component FlaG (FlaF/FlaG flagellin family)
MDKVLSTILLVVAAVICVTLVINAVYPAIMSSSGAVSSASARMSDRVRSQVEIIHAAGELDEDGNWQDTNSNNYFDVFVWVKNIGSEPVDDVKRCDVFLNGNQTVWAWIPHVDYAEGVFPQWDYVIENGSEWSTATTLKIEVSYETALSSGEYRIKTLIPNGVSDDYYFSM